MGRVHGIIKIFSFLSNMLRFIIIINRIIIFIFSVLIVNIFEIIIEWEIIKISSSVIYLTFIIDSTALYFIRLVRLVSGSVIIFSSSYMISEKFFSRFIFLVFIFIISIFLLILSPNIISLLLGWDGLGVTSYLLVIFYQRNKSYNAGILTALTNRLGDVGLLVSISLIIYIGSWSYVFVNITDKIFSQILVYLIVISACTKRAQIPFSAWLPAAIAAPTPVSALVHSSTLVTAGVYLLIRINLIIIEINIRKFLGTLGILTIIIAGITAIVEIDIKKVIALSTLRQLGIIIIILGIGNPILSFFHLISHAFFKAILFICAGLIIHRIKDYQDIRKIGFNYLNINLSVSIIMIANIRLCGLPFLSGFYSKDLIIEIVIIKGKNIFLFFMLILGTSLTVIYSCRLNFLISLNFIKTESLYNIRENSNLIILGIFFLAPLSVIGGLIISWNIMSINKIIFLPLWIKSFVLLLIMASLMLYLYIFNNMQYLYKSIYIWFFSNIWFIPYSINLSLAYLSLNYSISFLKYVEIMWSEIFLFKFIFSLVNNSFFRKILDYLSFIYFFQVLEFFIIILLIYIFIR